MKVSVDPGLRDVLMPLDVDELAALEQSILTHGCLDPLVIWQGHGIVVDGHHRLDICERHGIPYEVVELAFDSREDVVVWIVDNQSARRNLTPFARGEAQLKKKAALERKGRKRMSDARKGLPSLANLEPHDTRSEMAEAADVSRGQMGKIEVIDQRADEETKAKLRKGETTINHEYKAIVQREKHAQQVAAVESWTGPSGKYHVIVADPPWPYKLAPPSPGHRADSPYPEMPMADILAMPVADHALDDCILWLWTTNAFMVQSYEVAEAWGFQVKTILTWAKDRMGTGSWLRGQTEHCLFAVRGKPVITLTNQTTLLHGPLRQHSRKPDEFYDLVDTLCPGTKLELFSRQKRNGWTAAGAEVGVFDGT